MSNGIGIRLLITGATGFIGSHLVVEALRLGWEVWAGVRHGKERSCPRLTDPRIHFIELDYTSPEALYRQAEACAPADGPAWHYVIHCAGVTKSPHVADFYRVNHTYTAHLVEALSQLPQPPLRFVLMSSLGSYGAAHDERGLISVRAPQRPETEYGKSKLLGEQALIASTLPYTILHLTGVYGEGETDYLMALQSIAKGVDFSAGLTPQLITFIFVDDVVRATYFVLQHPKAQGERYMLTDGNVYSDREFGHIAQELLGRKHVLHLRMPLSLLRVICKGGDLFARLTGRPTPLNSDKYKIFAQRSWACDDHEIRALGFTPTVTLRKGLLTTIQAARQSGLLK